jgi:hypothetical protein
MIFLQVRYQLTLLDETDALSKLPEQGVASWSRLISSLKNDPGRVQRVDNLDYRSSYTYHRKSRPHLEVSKLMHRSTLIEFLVSP